MMTEPVTPTAALFLAFVLGGLGLAEIAMPSLFGGIRVYFCRAGAHLAPTERVRLEKTLTTRTGAEGTDAYTRYAGVFTLALAALSLVPGVPYAAPYGASCLVLAVATLAAYLRFRRATQRRVAPLVRRSVWNSLPPLALAFTLVCIAGAAVVAVTLPAYRFSALAATISGIALCAIALRVAIAPALLFGDDTQLEYLVDERVRLCRATGMLALASAPAFSLVVLAGAALKSPPPIVSAFTLIELAAFLGVMVMSVAPTRRRLALP